jgi:hypothetical protein
MTTIEMKMKRSIEDMEQILVDAKVTTWDALENLYDHMSQYAIDPDGDFEGVVRQKYRTYLFEQRKNGGQS